MIIGDIFVTNEEIAVYATPTGFAICRLNVGTILLFLGYNQIYGDLVFYTKNKFVYVPSTSINTLIKKLK